jgi:hypothetical protein
MAFLSDCDIQLPDHDMTLHDNDFASLAVSDRCVPAENHMIIVFTGHDITFLTNNSIHPSEEIRIKFFDHGYAF